MKPFDLEAAKRGEPIQTRSGKPRRFLLYDPKLSAGSVLVATEYGAVMSYYEDGRYYADGDSNEPNHLVMATRKRQIWVRAYRDGDLFHVHRGNTADCYTLNYTTCNWLGPAVLVAEWEET